MSTICISQDASLSQTHELHFKKKNQLFGAIIAKVVGGMDYSRKLEGWMGASDQLTTHPFELFLQLFPQGLGTIMKLVLQLSVALLEALQNPALGLNISPLLERHDTHPHTGWMDDRRERQKHCSKSTPCKSNAVRC